MSSKTFQTVVLAAFGIFMILGIGALAIFRGGGGEGSGVPVVIWGTLPRGDMNLTIEEVFAQSDYQARYVEKPAESFERDFVEALAVGKGPDLVLVSQDNLVRFSDKLQLIPFNRISERTFKDSYIEEGELYLTSTGIRAIPFSIDPLIMYWNRNMFASEGLATIPSSWADFLTLPEKLTEKDTSYNITKSAVALGSYQNVNHAKEIISALILQTGNKIVSAGERQGGGGLASFLDDPAAASAISFYTEFANPVKPIYSWNRALPSSQEFFLRGNLGVYFGFGSEVEDIRRKSPNLNFDIAMFPQALSGAKVTYGKIYAIAITRSAKNPDSFAVLTALTSADGIKSWVARSGLPPIRRDLLATRPTDSYNSVLYNSALISRGWLDPNPLSTDVIFKNMIESITTGKERVSNALKRADQEISALLIR
ncbi:MAG: extracellular solute-binding protein [bacterium]|nr:extracellular solute-binding protein [bacterium]